jgi:heterodisulfide reductase subunit D
MDTESARSCMDAIAHSIRQNRAYYCLECGKCTAVCPISRREVGYSPRSMVEATITDRGGEMVHDGRLWSCLTCGRCSQICPSDVRFSEFTRDLRAVARSVEQEGRCSHGETIQTWMRMMTNPDLKQNRLEWLDEELRTSSDSDTLYFVGCLPHYDVLFNEIGAQGLEIARSAVKVLNHLGIEPIVLADERCCGHDLLWEGDFENFRKLAELNVALLRETGAKRIVTTCPECAHTLKVDYRAFGGGLDMEVLHLSQFLAQKLEAGQLELEELSGRVTYQDPCRLGRYLGVYDEPRQVMAALGLELAEMEYHRGRALCCGTSAWTHCGATAKSIQVDRLREARATGAETLVTACAKCQIHFRCAMDDARLSDEIEIEVKDLTSLVAEALVQQEK